MKKSIIIFFGIISLTVISFKKETTETTVLADPTFNLTSPIVNEIYHFGDTIKVIGSLSADYEMHGYDIILKNMKTGMNVLNQGYHLHQSSYTINEEWKNTVIDTCELKITVDVAIDHDGTLKSFERIVTCYPQ
jgi:hypothetical protein